MEIILNTYFNDKHFLFMLFSFCFLSFYFDIIMRIVPTKINTNSSQLLKNSDFLYNDGNVLITVLYKLAELY